MRGEPCVVQRQLKFSGENLITQIFKSSAAPGLKAFILMVVSILCILLDNRSENFHLWRTRLEVVVMPIQEMVNGPIKMVHWLSSNITAQRKLLDENAELRAHEFVLESKLQKLLTLERENAQLKQLLQSTAKVSGKVKVAQLLAVSLDASLQQMVLNKGNNAGVYVGQPVLDAYGVMGQVVDVSPFTSKVLLVTDTRAAVPVQDYRNGIRAIAVGTGVGRPLALINIPDTSDIRVGDLFVSSGLGLLYPVGYPVGQVTKIDHVSGKSFAVVDLAVAAHLDQTAQVLLAWPNKPSLVEDVQRELNKPLPTASEEHPHARI